MPDRHPIGQRYATFGLGVSDFLPFDLIGDNESQKLGNIQVHKNGAMQRRGGISGTITLAALSGDGRPRLQRIFEAQGHGPARVSLIQESDTTSSLQIQDNFGALISIGLPYNVSDEVDLVQILNRIYILEPGHSPLFWQWGNVKAMVDGFGSTTFPQCRSAMFFKGRAWAGQSDGDLLFFSLSLGAEPYETFLGRTQTLDAEAIAATPLSESERGAATDRAARAVDNARRRARRNARRLASREDADDQDGFAEFENERADIESTFGITLPELTPEVRTEGEDQTTAFGQFVWSEAFQAFRMATGKIVALLPFRNDVILIFTKRGLEILEPDACDILESRRVTVSNVIGCGAAQSIQVVGEDVMFMDQDGHIRSVAQTQLAESQGVAAVPLSQKIDNVIERQNKAFLNVSRSVLFEGVYYIAMPMDGARVPTEIWGYSVRDKAWVGPYTFDPTVSLHGFAPARLDGAQPKLFALIKDGSRAKSVTFLSGRQDFSTAIASEFRSRNFVHQQPTTRKTWTSIDIEARVLEQLSINPTVFRVDVRGEESAWITLALLTLGTNASPNFQALGNGTFGLTLPIPLVPDGRQRLKASMTSTIPNSHGLQLRLTESGTQNDWEILALALWGLVDPVVFDR